MTEMLKKEFSRKSFVKGGGAMVVGFSLVGAGLGARAATSAGADPYASNGPFDDREIDSWITIHADNTATLRQGPIELGQGSLTGLLMIAAEELDMTMAQMRHTVNNDTNETPVNFYTAGSSAIARGGTQVRGAAAAAKSALLDLAAKNLGVSKGSLSVKDGVVSGGGKTVTYGALLGDKLFDVRMPASPNLAAGQPGSKPVAQYKPRDQARHPAGGHPGEGERGVHLRAQHQGAGHGARPCRAAPRPGRLRRRYGAEGALGRRELDQEHRRREGRAVRRLGRRRRSDRVRGDPGVPPSSR